MNTPATILVSLYRQSRQTSVQAWLSATTLLALTGLFGALWLWHLGRVALTAPMDNIEQLVWSHSAQWGYHKHPPLPTWLLLPWVRLLGYRDWIASVLGALVTLSAMAVFHATLRRLWGWLPACIGLLLGLSITFYNGRLNYYNHNVLLLLAVSTTVYLWCRIFEDGRTRWWLGLGVTAGLGMLSKYQYAVTLMPSLYCMYLLKPWRNKVVLRQAGLALLVALMLFAPHLGWLLSGDWQEGPLRYALHTARPDFLNGLPGPTRVYAGVWLLDLVFNRCVPAVVLALSTILIWRIFGFGQSAKPVPATDLPSGLWRGHVLLAWAILPATTMTLLGWALKLNLQMQWGTAFALWLVPGLMRLCRLHRIALSKQAQRWVVLVFVLLQALLMLHSYETSPAGCCNTQKRWRSFDSAAIARELDAAARDAAGGEFKVLVGTAPVAGAIALALPESPKILIDGRESISPWITHDELYAGGAVELFAPEQGPADVQRLPSGWGWKIYMPPD